MTILERMKEMQDAGGRICPRCGRWNMEIPIHHNALSRVADIYVCPDCGMDEALREHELRGVLRSNGQRIFHSRA